MNKCDKRITDVPQGCMQKVTRVCGKQVYKGTFCKHHWDRNKKKTTPFGNRPGYREPTLNELKSGMLVYAKNMTFYGGHYFRGGFMYKGDRSKNNAPTKYPVDPTKFVIKEMIESNADKHPEAWAFYVEQARNIMEEPDLKEYGNYRIPEPNKSGNFIYARSVQYLWSQFIRCWYADNIKSESLRGKIQYIVNNF